MSAQSVLAQRLDQLPRSVLHAVHRQVETDEREGLEVLRLHVGEPAFRPPPAACEAIARAMAEGRTGYSSAEGLPVLRERLAEFLLRGNAVATNPDRILVTPGSTHALAGIMFALCEPGDEILLPRIYWPIYAQAAAVAGLRIRTYPLDSDHGLDPDQVIALATPRTRLVIVNSPANPTGAVCDRSVLTRLLDGARRCDLWIVSDEAYEQFVYEGVHTSCASLEADVAPGERRVLSVHTFSKGYAMTGYRMGYVVAPSDATATALRRVSEGTIIAPSTPVQYGALAALDDEEMPARARAQVLATRDAALAGGVSAGLLACLPPAGWYAMVDISATGLGSTEFADRLLLEQRVAVAPGSTFVASSAPDPQSVRVAFCGDRDVTVEGVRRLREFVDHAVAGRCQAAVGREERA